ncbi:MAG: glycosyltransferase 87 family protein [Corynebacterium sp.]|nr:glycosyltransferase 87 family protein [Corynebacterium sp.]
MTHISWKRLWGFWVLSRALMIPILPHLSGLYTFDVSYYRDNLTSGNGLAEYPLLTYWILALINLIFGEGFRYAFPIILVLLDAAPLAITNRYHHLRAGLFWLVVSTPLLPLMIHRTDYFSAALVTMGLWAFYRKKNWWLGMFFSLATTIKVWPAALFSLAVGHIKRQTTWVRIATFAIATLAITALGFLLTSTDRVLSPFRTQGERGLQVESIPATFAHIGRLFSAPGTYVISKPVNIETDELVGPGTSILTQLSSLAFIISLILIALCSLWFFFRPTSAPVIGSAITSAILLIICTNKVLSPQYLCWFLMPFCIILIFNQQVSRLLLILLCLTPWLTAIYFPFLWEGLLAGQRLPTLILILRNLCLVAATLLSLRDFLTRLRMERART